MINDTNASNPLIGFDLSGESYDGEPAEVVANTIWSMSGKLQPPPPPQQQQQQQQQLLLIVLLFPTLIHTVT
jgi:hypothetical protein